MLASVLSRIPTSQVGGNIVTKAACVRIGFGQEGDIVRFRAQLDRCTGFRWIEFTHQNSDEVKAICIDEGFTFSTENSGHDFADFFQNLS